MRMSRHVINDRMNRMMVIAQYIGWGDEFLSVYWPDPNDSWNDTVHTITTTGVIMIKDATGEKLITTFPADEDQAKRLCRICEVEYPTWLHLRIKKNMKIMRERG